MAPHGQLNIGTTSASSFSWFFWFSSAWKKLASIDLERRNIQSVQPLSWGGLWMLTSSETQVSQLDEAQATS
jgi:hypothetical protein